MIYKTAGEIKALARGKMLGKYNTASAAFVLIQIIVFVINLIVKSIVDQGTVFGSIVYGIIVIIIDLILTVFLVGELTIYLNFACGNKAKVSDVFSYFRVHPDKAIVMQLLIIFRIMVWGILFSAALTFAMISLSSPLLLIVGIVAAIACFIMMMKVAIDLSQAFYLLLDFPQYTARELLAFSKDVMKGHRKTYICLILSFIPYGILGVASAGIGMLFVYPFIKLSLSEFYLDIIKEPENTLEEDAHVDVLVPMEEAVPVVNMDEM